MICQSLPLIISQLSAIDIVLLAVVIFLLLFGRKLPGLISRFAASCRAVKENIDIARGAPRRYRRRLAPAVRKRYIGSDGRQAP